MGFDVDAYRERLVTYLAARQLPATDLTQRVFDLEALRGVAPESDRIHAWRTLRREGLLPAAAAGFLIMSDVEQCVEQEVDRRPDARALRARMDQLCTEAGFRPGEADADYDETAYEDWLERRSPPAFRSCARQIRGIEERCTARILRDHGEVELADLFERARDAYDAMRATGRAFFLPSRDQ